MLALARVLLGAALVAALPAQQTTLTAQTLGDVAVLASSGASSAFELAPGGTPIGAGAQRLDLAARLDQGSYLSATTLAYPTQPYQDGIGLNFFERAYARGTTADVCGSSSSAAAAGAQFGPHALLLSFANLPGTRGKLVFQFRANAGTHGTVGARLDLGNDGSFEAQLAATATREFPATIPQSGVLTVRVDNECRVSGSGNPNEFLSCWTELWVGFRPDRVASCTITSYGVGCGPSAQASDAVIGSNRVVTFLVTNAFPNEPCVAITGAHAVALPLPGGCSILSSLEVATLLSADALGIATHNLVIPAITIGTSHHQFVPVRLVGQDLVIATTNGLRVDCR